MSAASHLVRWEMVQMRGIYKGYRITNRLCNIEFVGREDDTLVCLMRQVR
jgi:hypothetical protein